MSDSVGLQTPGEKVDVHFFKNYFHIPEVRSVVKKGIYDFPLPVEQGDPTILMQNMVHSYLVHNGYSQTAEAFARQKTSQSPNQEEAMSSRRIPQKEILKLVRSGKMGQAIDQTMRLYPGLLENNKNLWFMLKCRQFIEIINGSDVEFQNDNGPNNSSNGTLTAEASTSTAATTSTNSSSNTTNSTISTTTTAINNAQNSNNISVINPDNDLKAPSNLNEHIAPSNDDAPITKSNNENDMDMENNGQTSDVDMTPSVRKYSYDIEHILKFGKELSQMGQQLEKENKMTEEESQMLNDAFGLIAYSNPWSSPLGWQLCPTKRETVCRALNSAILESMNCPKLSPLEYCVAHANELLKIKMGKVSLNELVNFSDVFPKN